MVKMPDRLYPVIMVGGDSNFVFLQKLEPQVFRLGVLAERYFVEDPNTCQIKLRQLSELTAQLTASRFGLAIEPSDNFANILRNRASTNDNGRRLSLCVRASGQSHHR